MKVFLSGCAGFLGAKIAEILLSSNHEVFGIDNFYYNNNQSIFHLLDNKKFTFTVGDVRDKDLINKICKQCDIIMPLAAIVGAPPCEKNPILAKEINEDCIKSLVDMLSKSQRIIFPQTNSGYGIGGKNKCSEKDELNPISVYGHTKCNAEKTVMDHNNFVSLRLATVYGISARPRFDLMVNNFISELYYNGEITVYEPHFRRNFVHINDVACAFKFFCENNMNGIFNVGNDNDNLTKIQLADLIVSQLYENVDGRVKIGIGEDMDKRDYEVSSEKILSCGFKFNFNLTNGIKEVKNLCSIITKNDTLKMRNY